MFHGAKSNYNRWHNDFRDLKVWIRLALPTGNEEVSIPYKGLFEGPPSFTTTIHRRRNKLPISTREISRAPYASVSHLHVTRIIPASPIY